MKTILQVIESASDEQIRSWFANLSAGIWPTDMPIPMEAFHAVYHKMQQAYRELPLPAEKP